MKHTGTQRVYFIRLLVSSLAVMTPSFLICLWQGNCAYSLVLPWFLLDERLGWYGLIPETWMYPAALSLATVLTLVFAAKWKRVCVIVTSIFTINLLLALYFFSVYDPKA